MAAARVCTHRLLRHAASCVSVQRCASSQRCAKNPLAAPALAPGVAHGYAGSMVSGEAADSGDSLSAHSHGAKVAPSPDAKDPEGGEEQPQHGICIHPHKHPNAYSGALAIGTQRQKVRLAATSSTLQLVRRAPQ